MYGFLTKDKIVNGFGTSISWFTTVEQPSSTLSYKERCSIRTMSYHKFVLMLVIINNMMSYIIVPR